MILHGVVAYLAGLWLGPFLSLFPLSLLGALLSFGFFLTWFEQRRSLSRCDGVSSGTRRRAHDAVAAAQAIEVRLADATVPQGGVSETRKE